MGRVNPICGGGRKFYFSFMFLPVCDQFCVKRVAVNNLLAHLLDTICYKSDAPVRPPLKGFDFEASLLA